MIEPREVINPGAHRVRPIAEWMLGHEPNGNSYTPVPVDPVLTPEEAYHEVCGSPLNPAPGWDWKYDSAANRYYPIALRPKTPIEKWTLAPDMVTAIPVDPRLSAEEAYHPEYGSPLFPAPGFKWEVNSMTGRFIPRIADEPSRFWTPKLRYRWHPDAGHYSLVREDDDDGDGEDTLYEYDIERRLFNRHQPSLEPESGTPRQRLFVRRPDGTYTDIVHDYYPTMNRLVPITK